MRTRDKALGKSFDKKLRSAIKNRRLIRITYDGAIRTGEPHDYGMLAGAPKLLFYQLRRTGYDVADKSATGWRLLNLSKIEACSAINKTFPGSRGSAHRQHIAWDELFARVGSADLRPRPKRKQP